MSKTNQILIAILCSQLLLTVILFSSQDDHQIHIATDNFIDLSLDKIDSITITNSDNEVLPLTKAGNQWQLSNYFNVPANTEKLDKVTRRLFTLKTGWPVATTEEAAPRFKVAKDQFETRIVFKNQGKVLETLYLGNAPDFRRIHARKASDNAIYNIDFSSFETNIDAQDWMAKDLLKLKVTDLIEIKSDSRTLTHSNGIWQLDNLSTNQLTDIDLANNLVTKIANLSYNAIAGRTELAEYGLSQAELNLQLHYKNGNKIKLKFAKGQDDNYIGKSSTQPYYFKINQHSIAAISESQWQNLVTEKVIIENTNSPASIN